MDNEVATYSFFSGTVYYRSLWSSSVCIASSRESDKQSRSTCVLLLMCTSFCSRRSASEPLKEFA